MRVGAPTTDVIQKSILTTQGDFIVRGPLIPERLASAFDGYVLRSVGIGAKPGYSPLFDILTTQGDLWVRGAAVPQRIAAGLLDTYFKGQGAGALPIYEKMTLNDTGVKIGNGSRSATGDQVITGVGFQPSTIIFLVVPNPGNYTHWSMGFSDGTVNHCIFFDVSSRMNASSSFVSSIEVSAGDKYTAVINTLGSDGFTITWVKIGAAFDVYFYYLCLP